MERIIFDPFQGLRLDGGLTDRIATPKRIKNHGSVGSDLEIDWNDGGVQIVILTAVITITFTGWSALGSGDEAQAGTLILIDSGDFNPAWLSLLQTEGGADFTYTPDKSIVLEFLNVNGGENVPYAGWQVSSDTYLTLGAELLGDPAFDTPGDWDVSAAGISIAAGQMLFDTTGSVSATETVPFTVVAGASYLCTAVKASNTNTAIHFSIGGVDGANMAAGSGTEAVVIVASDTTEFSIQDDTGDGTTALDSVSVKRLY